MRIFAKGRKRAGLVAGVMLCMAVPAVGMEAYQAQDIQPYQAQGVQPYRANDVQQHRAEEIQEFRSPDVKPSRIQDAPSAQRGSTHPVMPTASRPAPEPEKQKKPKARKAASALLGIWQTNIPGAVYTTPSGQAGYDILHVSSGVAAGLLKINANGTYSWNSYGGKKGKWVESADPEYPVEIIDTVENRRWKVGYSSSKGTLIIWSGSFWYEGRRAAVKK